uniref:Uncharacterized protein n=1 Tax=Salix viminalis TaxID=40686 RepID=A0A6N2MWI7_SALVM
MRMVVGSRANLESEKDAFAIEMGRHLKLKTSNRFLENETRKLAENNSRSHVNDSLDKPVDATKVSPPPAPPTPVAGTNHPLVAV